MKLGPRQAERLVKTTLGLILAGGFFAYAVSVFGEKRIAAIPWGLIALGFSGYFAKLAFDRWTERP